MQPEPPSREESPAPTVIQHGLSLVKPPPEVLLREDPELAAAWAKNLAAFESSRQQPREAGPLPDGAFAKRPMAPPVPTRQGALGPAQAAQPKGHKPPPRAFGAMSEAPVKRPPSAAPWAEPYACSEPPVKAPPDTPSVNTLPRALPKQAAAAKAPPAQEAAPLARPFFQPDHSDTSSLASHASGSESVLLRDPFMGQQQDPRPADVWLRAPQQPAELVPERTFLSPRTAMDNMKAASDAPLAGASAYDSITEYETALPTAPVIPPMQAVEVPYLPYLGASNPNTMRLTTASHMKLRAADSHARTERAHWRPDSNNIAASLEAQVINPGDHMGPATLIRFATWPSILAEYALRGKAHPHDINVVSPHTAEPWSEFHMHLPEQAKWYYNENAIWIALRPEQAREWLTPQQWLPGQPHPLAARPMGATLSRRPTEEDLPNAEFPSRHRDDLLRWSGLNRGGCPPSGVYGWVLLEDAPHDEDGIRVHAPALGVYHPPFARDRPKQPYEGAELCHNFQRRGICPFGRVCHHMHAPHNVYKALCRTYHKGERCRPSCERIHGLDINDPQGRDLHTSLQVKPDTVPEILTTSPWPPRTTFRERANTPRPLWCAVPCWETYSALQHYMTESLYGAAQPSPNWRPTQLPQEVHDAEHAVDYALTMLAETRVLPPEISLEVFERHILPLVDEIPHYIANYDEHMGQWLEERHDGGHWMAEEHRPSRRVLLDRLREISARLNLRAASELRHIRRHADALRPRPRR